jgi:hypothetical protein
MKHKVRIKFPHKPEELMLVDHLDKKCLVTALVRRGSLPGTPRGHMSATNAIYETEDDGDGLLVFTNPVDGSKLLECWY